MIHPPNAAPCRVKTTGWMKRCASRIARKLTGIRTTPKSAYTAQRFARCGPASIGATKKTRASAVVTRTSDAAASAGSGRRYVRPTSVIVPRGGSLGDDVLERGPAEEREHGVVEREEREVSRRG